MEREKEEWMIDVFMKYLETGETEKMEAFLKEHPEISGILERITEKEIL